MLYQNWINPYNAKAHNNNNNTNNTYVLSLSSGWVVRCKALSQTPTSKDQMQRRYEHLAATIQLVTPTQTNQQSQYKGCKQPPNGNSD